MSYNNRITSLKGIIGRRKILMLLMNLQITIYLWMKTKEITDKL